MLRGEPGSGEHTLSLGELALRTGVTPQTLRRWERVHGFPAQVGIDGGGRRYPESDVDRILDVLRRRSSGVRLDAAIAQSREHREWAEGPGVPSVYAELKRLHPELPTYELRKSTLLSLSWAIEDEFCADSLGARLFGCFQQRRFFGPSQARWRELSRQAKSAYAFADFGSLSGWSDLALIPLADEAPMRQEWAIVCDSPDTSIVLTAWELPDQGDVTDRDRVFDTKWSVDPVVVREAARVGARVAFDAGLDAAAFVLTELSAPPSRHHASADAIATLMSRVIGYVDRYAPLTPA